MTEILSNTVDSLGLSNTIGPLNEVQLQQLARSTAQKLGLVKTASDGTLAAIARGAQLLSGRFATPEATDTLVVFLRYYAREPRRASHD